MARRAGLLLALAALAACGDDGSPAPPEIQYGLEECGFCRMIVRALAPDKPAARPAILPRRPHSSLVIRKNRRTKLRSGLRSG